MGNVHKEARMIGPVVDLISFFREAAVRKKHIDRGGREQSELSDLLHSYLQKRLQLPAIDRRDIEDYLPGSEAHVWVSGEHGSGVAYGVVRRIESDRKVSQAVAPSIQYPLPSIEYEGYPPDLLIAELRRERDGLRVENELLSTRIAQERMAAFEARMDAEQWKSLTEDARVSALEAKTQSNKVLDAHKSSVEANRDMQRVILAGSDGRLQMSALFHGVVDHSGEDSAIVIYESDDGPIEHVYTKNQFLGGRLPAEGERVTIGFFMASEQIQQQESEVDIALNMKARRPNVIENPRPI